MQTLTEWFKDSREIPQILQEDHREFFEWLTDWNPDWELEYTGNIFGLCRAFEAGMVTPGKM